MSIAHWMVLEHLLDSWFWKVVPSLGTMIIAIGGGQGLGMMDGMMDHGVAGGVTAGRIILGPDGVLLGIMEDGEVLGEIEVTIIMNMIGFCMLLLKPLFNTIRDIKMVTCSAIRETEMVTCSAILDFKIVLAEDLVIALC